MMPYKKDNIQIPLPDVKTVLTMRLGHRRIDELLLLMMAVGEWADADFLVHAWKTQPRNVINHI